MRRVAGLLTALAAFAASAGPAAALPDEPDLVIRLPAAPTGAQVAPVFVDAFEEPGRLLYRFDAVIANQGGTLDLFRDPGSGGVRQAVWPGGEPSSAPKPDEIPSGATVADRSGSGAGFVYAYEKTHQHWHFSSAARYELQPAGGPARAAEKVGFCLFDSYGPGELLRLRRPGGGRGDVVRLQRALAAVGADGALPGRRGHLQRAAGAPVGRHHRPRARPGRDAGPGQPAALHPREQRGQQLDQRRAADPGRARGRGGGEHGGGRAADRRRSRAAWSRPTSRRAAAAAAPPARAAPATSGPRRTAH